MTEATGLVRQQPGHGQFQHRVALVGGERFELAYLVQSSLAQLARRCSSSKPAIRVPSGMGLAGAVLAGQEPTGQGEERKEGHAGGGARIQDTGFGLSVQDVVLVLDTDKVRHSQRAGGRVASSSWATEKLEQPI